MWLLEVRFRLKISSHPEVNGRPDLPIDIALTEFHVLILFRDRLTAVSTLNEKVTYEDLLGQVAFLPALLLFPGKIVLFFSA